MNRADLLRAHIEAAQGDVVIGVNDCGPWVMQWIKAACGREAKFPRYSTRSQAYEIVAKAGGLVALASPIMAAADLSRAPEPEFGDVAVLKLSDRETAAIMCEGGVMVARGEARGTVYLRPQAILAAWHVPEC